MTTVLAISGSLRAGSYNTQLLDAARRVAPPGVEIVAYTGLKAVPPFDEDDEAAPALAVKALRRAVESSDALLVATPEYNHSLPGQLKNALDWLSRPYATNPLRGKPVAVVGASTGLFGAVWAQAEARKVLQAIGADVLDEELPVGEAHDRIGDPEVDDALAGILRALTTRARGRAAA
jgi:chromate reductase